jgi:hypothetical protein
MRVMRESSALMRTGGTAAGVDRSGQSRGDLHERSRRDFLPDENDLGIGATTLTLGATLANCVPQDY